MDSYFAITNAEPPMIYHYLKTQSSSMKQPPSSITSSERKTPLQSRGLPSRLPYSITSFGQITYDDYVINGLKHAKPDQLQSITHTSLESQCNLATSPKMNLSTNSFKNSSRIHELNLSSEIPKLLSRLKRPATTATNWKQRAIDNLKLLTSGSAFDLAEVVESLTELNEQRALSPRDRQTLDKAKKILICEIAEVTGKTRSVVEEQVDGALNLRKGPKATGRRKASAPEARDH